ncbi:MAG: alpha/beta hydrolase, partial [Campylobacteraceae bacterium]|nr:alpha/beta hydrolase [Campylobacteraceae bacterium]
MPSKFFSGFSLQGEKELFQTYLSENDFTVCGFSYGAQQAFDYVLNSKTRVDLLQLFSPAFFQDKDLKYKRMQLMYFKKDALNYCSNFLDNSVYPTNKKLDKYFRQGSYEDL